MVRVEGVVAGDSWIGVVIEEGEVKFERVVNKAGGVIVEFESGTGVETRKSGS